MSFFPCVSHISDGVPIVYVIYMSSSYQFHQKKSMIFPARCFRIQWYPGIPSFEALEVSMKSEVSPAGLPGLLGPTDCWWLPSSSVRWERLVMAGAWEKMGMKSDPEMIQKWGIWQRYWWLVFLGYPPADEFVCGFNYVMPSNPSKRDVFFDECSPDWPTCLGV